MSITATCGACGRNFVAPSQFQGKRVKCKGCGEIFTVPRAGGGPVPLADNGPEADPLQQLASVATSDSSQGLDSIRPSPVGFGNDEEKSAPQPAKSLEDFLGLTPNVLTYSYAGAADVDRWLALAVIIVGFLLLLASTSSSDTKGVGWISLTRFLTPTLLYSALVYPITLSMVRKAGKELRYAMPPNFKQRCFACYLPAFILVTWTTTEGFTLAQLFAGLLGLIVGSGMLWLLFRLREEQFGTMIVYGAGGFVGGAALTVLLTLGLNHLGMQAVADNNAQAQVPASPFADGLHWIAAAPAAPAAPAPVKTVPTTSAPVETAVTAVAPQPIAGTLGMFDKGSIPGMVDDFLVPLGTGPFIGVVRKNQSAVSIESWNTQTWQSKTGTLRLPGMPSGNIIISTDGEHLAWIADFPHLSIQVWSFTSGSVVGSVDLDRSRGHQELVGFIDSNVLLIDRTVAKVVEKETPPAVPSTPVPAASPAPPAASAPPAVEKTQNIFDMTPAPTPAPAADTAPHTDTAAAAVPKPVPSVPAIHFDMRHELSTIDISTGQTVQTFSLPPLADEISASTGTTIGTPLRFGKNIAFSVAAKRLVAAVATNQSPSLVQIDLTTGQPLATIKVPEVDPGMSGTLTGLAYSNDGQQLAALFENGGSGLLLAYDANSAAKISNFVYPSGPLDGAPHGPFDGSAICWLDPAPLWLVYGQGVVSTKTGAHLKEADLTLADPVHQRFSDGDRIELLSNSVGNKLNMLKIDRTRFDTYPATPGN